MKIGLRYERLYTTNKCLKSHIFFSRTHSKTIYGIRGSVLYIQRHNNAPYVTTFFKLSIFCKRERNGRTRYFLFLRVDIYAVLIM